MRRRLVLHVGLPKTGTSAMQAWLHDNAEALGRSGIEYPDAFLPGGDTSHRWIVSGLLSHDLGKLRGVLSGASKPTLVLSSEGLTNHLYDFSPQALEEFRGVTDAFDVTLLLAIRDIPSWLHSYYRHSVINPNNGISDLWGTKLSYEDYVQHPRMRQLMDHPALIADLKAAYGAAALIRLDYDADWFGDMLKAVGLGRDRFSPPGRINESVREWITALMLRINRRNAGEPERRLWRAALQLHCPTQNSVFQQSLKSVDRRDFAVLDPEIVEEEIRERVIADKADVDELLSFADFLKTRARSA